MDDGQRALGHVVFSLSVDKHKYERGANATVQKDLSDGAKKKKGCSHSQEAFA
jgi:hypothetical protein